VWDSAFGRRRGEAQANRPPPQPPNPSPEGAGPTPLTPAMATAAAAVLAGCRPYRRARSPFASEPPPPQPRRRPRPPRHRCRAGGGSWRSWWARSRSSPSGWGRTWHLLLVAPALPRAESGPPGSPRKRRWPRARACACCRGLPR
jgi:hypothetical protein